MSPIHPRRPPLSDKQPTTPLTRKQRRAAERQDRFDAAREERRARAASGGGGSSWINTRTMTLVGILAGAIIVAVVAFGQLGSRASGQLTDPGIEYPASIQDGQALGPADAPVTLEVWEDYQCPVCARYVLEVEPSIVNEFVIPGRVRIVHHDISILGRTSPETPTNESTIPAKGAFCANEQDLFWPYAHWIYANQDGENRGGFRTERVTEIAVAAGVEEAAFSACIATPEALTSVLDSTQAATDLTINSTPTFRINDGELIRGLLTIDQLSELLDQALAAASPAP